MLGRRDLDQVHRSGNCCNRREERQHEATANESRNRRSDRCHDCPNTSPKTSNEYRPSAPMPICDPAEQRSDHLADLEYGKDESSAAVALWREVKVCSVTGHGVDRTHKRSVVAYQESATVFCSTWISLLTNRSSLSRDRQAGIRRTDAKSQSPTSSPAKS